MLLFREHLCATVQFEAAGADGVFHALLMTPSGSATQASSATAAGLWTVNVSGMAGIRVRVSTYGSGTVVATINPSPTAAIFPGSGVCIMQWERWRFNRSMREPDGCCYSRHNRHAHYSGGRAGYYNSGGTDNR